MEIGIAHDQHTYKNKIKDLMGLKSTIFQTFACSEEFFPKKNQQKSPDPNEKLLEGWTSRYFIIHWELLHIKIFCDYGVMTAISAS
jgi:hypothetical protein